MKSKIVDFEPPFKIEDDGTTIRIEGGDGEGGTVQLVLLRRDAIDLGDKLSDEVAD